MLTLLKKRLLNLKVTDYLILLAVTAVGIFFFASFYKKPEIIFVDITTLRNNYSQDMTPPEYWQLSGIKVGDKVFNPFGKAVAELVTLEKTPWRLGTMETAEMVLKYSAVFDNRVKVYTVDGKPLRVGDQITVNFGSQQFTGLIRNVYKNKEDRFEGFAKKTGELVVQLREYDPWQIEKLRNFVLKDSNDVEIVRVIKVETKPSSVFLYDHQGSQKLLLGNNPNKVDAILTMKVSNILCTRKGACMFNYYHSMGIGNGFYADNGETAFGVNSSIIDFRTD